MKRGIHIHIVVAAFVLMAAVGCRAHKDSSSANTQYHRMPIKEVTQETLDNDSRLLDALALQQTDRNDEALGKYAELVKQAPDYAAAWYEMGRLLLRRGWTDSASHCAQRAIDLNGENIWYRLLMINIAEHSGDLNTQIAQLEEVVRRYPDRLEYYFDLSQCYVNKGDATAAVEVLSRIEKRIGITENVSLAKQTIWGAVGKSDKAQREIEALAEAYPQNKRYNAIIAEINMQKGNYRQAKKYYDKILLHNPDDEYIHVQLAEYYKKMGDDVMADSMMIEAFKNTKLDATTKLQLLGSFYTTEEFYNTRSETTFRLLEMAMQNSVDSTTYALLYGDVLMRQGRTKEAIRQFQLAMNEDSSSYAVWEAMLICLATDSTRQEMMLDYAIRAQRLFPVHTLPYYLQASVMVEKKEYEQAINKLTQTMRWGFNKRYLELECYSLLAECYYRLADYDKTWKALDHCLSLDPDNSFTLNNYAYYLSEQGLNLEKAEQMSKKTLLSDPQNANNLDTYAWILHKMERDKDALPYIQKALSIDSKSKTLQEHYSEIKNALGK